MRHRPLLAFAFAAAALAACSGMKEALTAHVDVVARANTQELSVTRLAEMLGNAKIPVPPTKENAGIIADLWVNYQLLGHAAAVGDSLADKKLVDMAAEPIKRQIRLRKFTEQLIKTFKIDSASEAAYDKGFGGLLAARHILFAYPQNASPIQRDSVKLAASTVMKQVSKDNFAQLATKYSADPGSKARGGDLGVFLKGQMVPQFGNAVATVAPGEIIGPVETQFGWHIIQRTPWSQVDKAQYGQMYNRVAMNTADSAYFARLDAEYDIEVKNDAPGIARSAALDLAKHRDDGTVLATFKGGKLTVGDYVAWLQGFPPQQQVPQRLQTVPDTAVTGFVKSVTQRQVILQKADSAKVTLTPAEDSSLYHDFGQLVKMEWNALNVDPKALADSGKTAAAREKIAANRVDGFLDRIINGQAQPVPVPQPLAVVLQSKYQWSINQQGLDKAVERAQQLRASADSARAAKQPKSEVPLPGGAPGTAPGAAAPKGAAPLTPAPQPPATKAPAPGTTKKP